MAPPLKGEKSACALGQRANWGVRRPFVKRTELKLKQRGN